MSLRPATLEIAHKLLDDQDAEINRLRSELQKQHTTATHLYEVDDTISIYKSDKQVWETKIIRGFRQL